jgi:hypothetical protein
MTSVIVGRFMFVTTFSLHSSHCFLVSYHLLIPYIVIYLVSLHAGNELSYVVLYFVGSLDLETRNG